ncbi:MAG: hypothetical protein LBL66_05540, partial [Clostridiales bacterium]|nr:hypothetical protein [Clostridiales bacterium]
MVDNIEILPSELKGEVIPPPSKSHLHRLLIAAALGERACGIQPVSDAADVARTVDCLVNLGARIDIGKNADGSERGYTVEPIRFFEGRKDPVLNCGESGSTLRFLLPVVGALGCGGTFVGEGRLPSRPIADLAACMRRGGCTVSDGFPLKVSGRLRPGNYTVAGGVSSQFITGLLFALSLLDGDSYIQVIGDTVSRNYIEMTRSVLENFGKPVEVLGDGYKIGGRLGSGGARPRVGGRYVAEADWSSAAFWLAAGALTGNVTVRQLDAQSPQGDKAIAGILQSMGAQFSGHFSLSEPVTDCPSKENSPAKKEKSVRELLSGSQSNNAECRMQNAEWKDKNNAQCTMHNVQLKDNAESAMRSAQIKEKSETVDCGLWTVDCENTSQFSI